MKSLKVFLILQALLCLFQVHAATTSELTIYSNDLEPIKKLFASTSDKAKSVQDKVSPFDVKGQFQIDHKEFSQFAEGTTIYIKIEQSATELIICQRLNELSWLNRTATQIFQQSTLAHKFITKGFKAKTDTESCQGHIYYLSEDTPSVAAIRKFTNLIPQQHLPLNFEAALSNTLPQTFSHIKIEVRDTITLSYRFYNIPLNFLSQNLQWEKSPSKTSSAASNIAVKVGSTTTKITFASNTRTQPTQQVSSITTKQGRGLHQKLSKELFVEGKGGKRVDFASQGDCKILLVDALTDQTYVDQDEVRYNEHMELKRFEVLDIEKPQVTAKQLLWMIRMNVTDLTRISGKNDELKVDYLVHFRYRDPAVEPYSTSQLFMRSSFFSNCKDLTSQEDIEINEFYLDKVRDWYGKEYKQIPLKHYLTVEDYKQGRSVNAIEEQIPVGNLGLKDIVTIITLITSVSGALILFFFIQKSAKTKAE